MQTIDRDRDRKSLQDLAQMAKGMTPSPSSVASFGPVPSSRSVTNLGQKDDSGIVDLAAASAADPQAAMRAQTTPLASQSMFDDVPPPPSVQVQAHAPVSQSYIPAPTSQSYIPAPPPVNPPPSGAYAYQQPAPSVPPPVASVPPPAYASVAPLSPSLESYENANANKRKGGLVIAIGGLLAISAAAAGGFLYLGKSSAPVATAAHTAEVAPAAPVAESPKADDHKPAEVAAADKPSDGTMDLNTLPNAGSTKATSTSAKSAHHATASSKHAAKEPAAEAAKEPAEDPAQAKAEKAKLDKMLAGAAGSVPAPAAPSGPPGDLGAALRAGSGGGIMQDQKPAAGSSGAAGGNIPQKPSQGAVTGALGAVLPAARECLGPDDPISKAAVVFNSDGSVAGVSVSGSAAGKPAATCIEKELKKAKVLPFAEPTYTANITIRHN